MANTEYEHAGNADQHREMQFDPAPRCEMCHYPQGYKLITTAVTLALEVVSVPAGRDTAGQPQTRPALFCQLCVQLCKMTRDGDFAKAASMIRPLPPETQVANQTLLNALQEGWVQVSETGKQDLTLHHEDGTTTEMKGGTMYIKRKDGDQNDQS